jgi:hypothetical protein
MMYLKKKPLNGHPYNRGIAAFIWRLRGTPPIRMGQLPKTPLAARGTLPGC